MQDCDVIEAFDAVLYNCFGVLNDPNLPTIPTSSVDWYQPNVLTDIELISYRNVMVTSSSIAPLTPQGCCGLERF